MSALFSTVFFLGENHLHLSYIPFKSHAKRASDCKLTNKRTGAHVSHKPKLFYSASSLYTYLDIFRFVAVASESMKCEVFGISLTKHHNTLWLTCSIDVYYTRHRYYGFFFSYFEWQLNPTIYNNTSSRNKNGMQHKMNVQCTHSNILEQRDPWSLYVTVCHATLNKWYELCWTTLKQTDKFTTGERLKEEMRQKTVWIKKMKNIRQIEKKISRKCSVENERKFDVEVQIFNLYWGHMIEVWLSNTLCQSACQFFCRKKKKHRYRYLFIFPWNTLLCVCNKLSFREAGTGTKWQTSWTI